MMMENPEANLELSPEVINAYDTHRNIPWNILEYQPVKEYLDPQRQVSERKYREIKKGEKDPNYVTKRGFYMDYHIKVVKALPSPGDHTFRDSFDQELNIKKSKFNKLDSKLSKYSYLDRIEMQEKNRKKPAPGSYNLNKTDAEIEKDKKAMSSKKSYIGNKHFFYEDQEHLSSSVPGMGVYNPHLDVPHLKINKTTHKLWIDKHSKESAKISKRKSVQPASGTYTPIPLEYNTFDRIQTAELVKKRKKSTVNAFGTDTKFQYDRPNKKKILEVRPAPCNYEIMLEWKGKDMDLRKNNWIRSRSTGFSQSVYN